MRFYDNNDNAGSNYEKAKEEYPEYIPWQWFKNHPQGSKSKVKEYLKTIRRLSLEIEKEI